SHKRDTSALVASLPASSKTSLGSTPYSFGDPTVVCNDFTVWRDDIEEELGEWPSFDVALTNAGLSLASRSTKNLLAYRNAVVEAEVTDLPNVFEAVIASIASLVGNE